MPTNTSFKELAKTAGKLCLAGAITGSLLVGCGTYVPNITDNGEDQNYFLKINESIKCELIATLDEIENQHKQITYLEPSEKNKYQLDQFWAFFNKWAVKYTLSLSTTSSSNFNPTLSILHPSIPNSSLVAGDKVFTINPGFGFSASATGKETSSSFYLVSQLINEDECEKDNPLVLFGNDLKLAPSILRRMSGLKSNLIHFTDKSSNISTTRSFEINRTASADPKLSFVLEDVSGVNALFGAGRKSSHSVVVTLGPADEQKQDLFPTVAIFHNDAVNAAR